VKALLYAFGDDVNPLPETVKVLDEIVTDFIIETCHSAAASAAYARRQKIKVDDFKFAIRKDPAKLGRVQELLSLDKELKDARRQFDQNDDKVVREVGVEDKGKGKAEDVDADEDVQERGVEGISGVGEGING